MEIYFLSGTGCLELIPVSSDTRSLRYGIDTHLNAEEHDQLGKLLKIPFEEYRPPAGSKFSVGD